jgi:polyisoprenoid-binding protein YceI
MKKIMYPIIALLIVGTSAFAFLGNWKVKSGEASVKFSGGKISGAFEGLKADINFDKAHPEQSKISATIEVENIATGFFLKNSHAKDALGAEKYPTIRFVSSSVKKGGSGYEAEGSLTMKGVTKPVTIHFTFDDKGSEGVFKGNFKVIPKEYGIDRSGTPDQVNIELVVPVSKA